MPLRDHFHAPLGHERHWEGFHSLWPGLMAQQLNQRLPARYFAEPHTHLGFHVEADVTTHEKDAGPGIQVDDGNGVATAVWAPPRPTQTAITDLPAQDVFELRIHDDQFNARLVAVVELISPSNKDREEHREAFLSKCVAYLQNRIGLVLIDIVSSRHADLHEELLRRLRIPVAVPSSSLYGVAIRTTRVDSGWQLDTWHSPLTLGQPLPTLPLWLAGDLAVPLELEASYE